LTCFCSNFNAFTRKPASKTIRNARRPARSTSTSFVAEHPSVDVEQSSPLKPLHSAQCCSRVSVCFIFVRSTAYLSYTCTVIVHRVCSLKRASPQFVGISFSSWASRLRRATSRSAQGCKFIILCISLEVDETKYLEIPL